MNNTGLDYIHVREGRLAGWFWGNRELIRRDGPRLGAYAIALYSALATYVDNETQEGWPSIDSLAHDLDCSKPTIIKATRRLEDTGWLHVHRAKKDSGENMVNVYTLLYPEEPIERRNGVLVLVGGSKAGLQGVVNDVDHPSKIDLPELDSTELKESNMRIQNSKSELLVEFQQTIDFLGPDGMPSRMVIPKRLTIPYYANIESETVAGTLDDPVLVYDHPINERVYAPELNVWLPVDEIKDKPKGRRRKKKPEAPAKGVSKTLLWDTLPDDVKALYRSVPTHDRTGLVKQWSDIGGKRQEQYVETAQRLQDAGLRPDQFYDYGDWLATEFGGMDFKPGLPAANRHIETYVERIKASGVYKTPEYSTMDMAGGVQADFDPMELLRQGKGKNSDPSHD